MSTPATPLDDELVLLPVDTAVEVTFVNDSPGSFTREPDNDSGSAAMRVPRLPIGPRRWLWLDVDADEVRGAVEAGAHVVDVDGKWTVFTCGGPGARRALKAVIDVDAVLESRGCASLALFDCPAVLARAGDDRFVICVQSSYAASFEAAYSGGARRA